MPKRSTKKQPKKPLFSHHRHTGKVLPHHHTSYPLLVLVLLIMGVFLTHMTLKVRAADIVVTATANGPLPPSAAFILSPTDGQRFNAIPIPVSGTCPTGYVVKLFRNNTFTGSVQCAGDGTWLIYTDLFAGQNELRAQAVNLADQEGPPSPTVTVFYDEPQQPEEPEEEPTAPGETPTETPTEEAPGEEGPFMLTTETFYKAVFKGEEVSWDFAIVGGDDPYEITIAWGDDETTTLNEYPGKTFSASHTYRDTTSRVYYPVTVTATDIDGDTATLQVFTILNDRITPGAASTTQDPGASDSGVTPVELEIMRKLIYAWPAYAVSSLMVVSFWLGEKRSLMIFSHGFGHGPKPIVKLGGRHRLK